MVSLLNRGLTFCPSEPEPNFGDNMKGLDKFFRQLRRTVFFSNPPDWYQNTDASNINVSLNLSTDSSDTSLDDCSPFSDSKFTHPSDFDPKVDNTGTLDTFCRTVKNDVYKHDPPPFRFHNLSPEERSALKEITNNPEIIVKPADKGNCVVLQDITDYITEAKRQLDDVRFYRPMSHDLTDKHNQEVGDLIQELLDRNVISDEVAQFLHIDKPRTACIYFLPKIHKPTRPPPGRPIVSANAHPTENISGLVDHHLRPYVSSLKSYVKDTTDFIQKIEALGPIDPNAYIVSLDVSALYTNIPNMEALKAAKATLSKYRTDTDLPLKNNDLIRMLALVLRCNNFEFNGEHYLQIQGVAMGTRVAPTIANLTMGEFESKHVYSHHLQPKIWLRFIDDIFMIWDHSRADLDAFIQHLNTCHQTIKFTHEISQTQISFLDTWVKRNTVGELYIDLYTKPTDTHLYLHYQSCHPKHQKTGGPFSQLLRLRRICTRDTDFETHAKNMIENYKTRGYPSNILTEALQKVRALDRSSLLNPERTDTEATPTESPLVCVLNYNPRNPPVKSIIEDNWNILESTPTLACISNKKVVIGNRRLPNLRDRLVSSRLRYPPPGRTHEHDPNTINPRKVCRTKTCRYCPKLDHSGVATSTRTGRKYIVPQKFTCQFNNLIYLITCKQCKSQYVGQTKNRILDRFQGHLADIRYSSNWDNAPPSIKEKGPTNVGLHFNQQHHSVSDVQIQVLTLIRAPPDSELAQELRDAKEHEWMHKLKTLTPFGINAMDDSTHYRSRRNRTK